MKAALLVAACAVLLLAGTRYEAEAGGARVTLALREFKNANFVRVLVFSGAVSKPEPGQDVMIVAEDCNTRGNRLFLATKTTAGGGFEITNENVSTPWSSGVTFRARWGDELSPPITYRLPAPLYAIRVRGRIWTVSFNPYDSRTKLNGKVVELQRFSGGRWTRFKSARLKLKPSLRLGAFNHEAKFTVPERGLRLRAFLPARSAAPCWAAGTSEPFRS